MTISAIEWLDRFENDARERGGTATYMYGLDSYIDGPCAINYDPEFHARELGIPIVHRHDLPTPQIMACYSRRHDAIFVRPNLHHAVEKCAIAHEIVHFEHADIGTTKTQEDRANRIAAMRLVRPSRLEEFEGVTDDPARMALELEVTETIMRWFMRLRRNSYV